jgi:ketosteroid isomerase-like protein
MSERNLELVEAVYARWNRNPAAMAKANLDGQRNYEDFALDLFDPAVEIRQTAAMLDTAGTFHGHEGMLQCAKELHEAFGSIEWAPERLTEYGEWVIGPVGVIAVGDASGIETRGIVTHAWRVRDGLITDFRVYGSERQAREEIEREG